LAAATALRRAREGNRVDIVLIITRYGAPTVTPLSGRAAAVSGIIG
jgi:hypothetical protein